MNHPDLDKKPNKSKEVRMPKPDKIVNQIRMKSRRKNRRKRTKAKDNLYEKEEPPEEHIMMTDEEEPKNFEEAKEDTHSCKWLNAM